MNKQSKKLKFEITQELFGRQYVIHAAELKVMEKKSFLINENCISIQNVNGEVFNYFDINGEKFTCDISSAINIELGGTKFRVEAVWQKPIFSLSNEVAVGLLAFGVVSALLIFSVFGQSKNTQSSRQLASQKSRNVQQKTLDSKHRKKSKADLPKKGLSSKMNQNIEQKDNTASPEKVLASDDVDKAAIAARKMEISAKEKALKKKQIADQEAAALELQRKTKAEAEKKRLARIAREKEILQQKIAKAKMEEERVRKERLRKKEELAQKARADRAKKLLIEERARLKVQIEKERRELLALKEAKKIEDLELQREKIATKSKAESSTENQNRRKIASKSKTIVQKVRVMNSRGQMKFVELEESDDSSGKSESNEKSAELVKNSALKNFKVISRIGGR